MSSAKERRVFIGSMRHARAELAAAITALSEPSHADEVMRDCGQMTALLASVRRAAHTLDELERVIERKVKALS